MTSYKPVTAALRALEVLRVVNRLCPTTLKAIHAETGFDKATIVRMLQTLIHAGYITQDTDTGAYSVAGRVLQLSVGYSLHDQVADICTPILTRLRRAIGWPSDFAIRDAESMIVVQTTRTQGPLLFNRRPGFRAPMLLTSIGQAYLAACSDRECDEILTLLQTGSGGRNLSMPNNLERRLATIRQSGYAVMDNTYSQAEYGGTIWAIAVPVASGGRVYGALNIMLLRETVDEEMVKERYLPLLKDTAAELEHAFHTSDSLPIGL